MKPRQLGGAIGRADAIYVWVPYTEVVYEYEEEEVPKPAPSGVELAEGEEVEEEEEDTEEIGYWLAVTKVQARELVAEACTREDIEDMDVMAEERGNKLYIGVGPLP